MINFGAMRRLKGWKGSMDSKKLAVVDLFAGCGGLSLGLEQAGFFPAYVNELNSHARETYLSNRTSINSELIRPEFHSSDVRALTEGQELRKLQRNLKAAHGIEHGELGLVVGGPPCQGYSGIGHRRSYAVDKLNIPSNHLYLDMVKVISELRPRAFVFENVKGILTSSWTPGGPRIWTDVLEAFRSLEASGYRVAYELLHAKDYGVPQNRPRVILVGIRNDAPGASKLRDGAIDQAVARGFLPEKLIRSFPDPVDLLSDLVDPNYQNGGSTLVYPRDAESEIQRKLRTPRNGRKPLPQGAEVSEQDYSLHSDHVRARFRTIIQTRGKGPLPEHLQTKKFAQRWLPPRWPDEPTITATSLPDDYVHYKIPRTLTVREWARLQTFPDWYQFKGPRTTGGLRRAGNPQEGLFERDLPRYTQIGNAVPVMLAEKIGLHLKKIIGR